MDTKMKKVGVVIPTYNEKENIPELFKELGKVSFALRNRYELHIIFVDDGSPDGTGKLIKQNIGKRDFEIHLIERQGKLGLGSAYTRGFKEAITKNTDFIIQMDADLSHDPKVIPEMVKNLEKYNFIIGSRYIKGGKLPKWTLMRKFISWGGNFYSRLILGFSIHDYTGGFNGYNKKVLETINLDAIKSNGYSYQIELKFRAKSKGFIFKEIPIHFHDRTYGESKFSKDIFFEALLNNIRMRFSI